MTCQGNNILMLENAVMADRSSTTRATFWGEDVIDQLKEGGTFKFTNMKVDVFKQKYKLVAIKDTCVQLSEGPLDQSSNETNKSIIEEKYVDRITQINDLVMLLLPRLPDESM